MEQNYKDPFLEGNEQIEDAIKKYHEEASKENLIGVLESIRARMHADGHFIIPVEANGDDDTSFEFRGVQANDGKIWNVIFTSEYEFQKGQPSKVVSNFIDSTMKACIECDAVGVIINPWSDNSFMLSKELIQMIFDADGDTEYIVPEVDISAELLEDGALLKRVVDICSRNRTQLNVIKLMRILRDSFVWVPCNAVFSDADNENVMNMVKVVEQGEGLESLEGKEFSTKDEVRMIPDILQNGDEFFFPVFTTAEEMGEYGDNFSKMERHFMETINLACNNNKKVSGIVINAFSNPFVVSNELLEIIEGMESNLEVRN